MSLRVKAALFIITIVSVITAAMYLTNLSFTRKKITESMEQDLALALDIANDLVSTKIRLLKADAETVAERLISISSREKMEEAMAAQLELYPEFVSLTVHERRGVIANYGEPVDFGIVFRENHHIQRAFLGLSTISSPYYSRITGSFFMHVFMPMANDMVLSATIPGMTFADIVGRYRFLQTGSIYIVDREGTFVASYDPQLVQERRSFIVDSINDPEMESAGNFVKNMLSTNRGSGTYVYNGKERLCVYSEITSSNSGWHIAVTAPFAESPESNLQKGLLLSSLFFLAMGIVISFFASGFAAKPFLKIQAQNKKLADLNETVQAASEEKSKFLAKMSHEIRTPLNAVIGLSELVLYDGGINHDARINIEKVYNAGSTILSTVNDILDISKIESGKFELIPVVYDTPGMINDTITQSIMRKGDKPIEFILNIDEKIPARLHGDDLRIKQILINLLSNAFKYTREGTVELSVYRETSHPANGGKAPRVLPAGEPFYLCASVKDTGIGIPPDSIGSLFTEYNQVDQEQNRKIEGTGLGLSITKMMVEMMGGTISVESEYGKGSVFTVKIPQKLVTKNPIGKTTADNLKNMQYFSSKRDMNLRMSRISLPYAKVLVVDDVPTNLDVAKGMLKPYRILVDCLSSGKEAIKAVQEEKTRYNAIFMDHMMPEMDGIETTRIIREEIGTEYAKNVPIIALTANAIVGTEEVFLANGFQAFISKPIEINQLDEILRRFVRDKELEKSLAMQKINVDGELYIDSRTGRERRQSYERRTGVDRRILINTVEGLDVNSGLERFSGNKESYLHILQSFVSSIMPLIEKVKNVSKDSLEDYMIIVHGIKGSCRGICAEAVGDLAETLEVAAKGGNFDFVAENNPSFIAAASKLVDDIKNALSDMAEKEDKPKKDKPETEMLVKLFEACKNLDTSQADEIIKEMERFEYESDGGLVLWLRESAEQMNYTEIAARLSGLIH